MLVLSFLQQLLLYSKGITDTASMTVFIFATQLAPSGYMTTIAVVNNEIARMIVLGAGYPLLIFILFVVLLHINKQRKTTPEDTFQHMVGLRILAAFPQAIVVLQTNDFNQFLGSVVSSMLSELICTTMYLHFMDISTQEQRIAVFLKGEESGETLGILIACISLSVSQEVPSLWVARIVIIIVCEIVVNICKRRVAARYSVYISSVHLHRDEHETSISAAVEIVTIMCCFVAIFWNQQLGLHLQTNI